MFTCRDIPEHATAYAEGTLGPWKRLMMMIHLSYCGMCRTYMRQLAWLRGLMGAAPMPPPPPEVEENALRTLPPPG